MRKKMLLLTMMAFLMCSGAIVHAGGLLAVWNNDFETPATTTVGPAPTYWNVAGCGTVNPAGWPDAGISAPAAASGLQTAYLDAGGWMWQSLKQPGTADAFKIEANQTYTIKVWVGRMIGQDVYVPLLEVFLQDTTTWTQVDNQVQDLSWVGSGAANPMVELTYTLATGPAPTGVGNAALVYIRNNAAGGWTGRVMVDSVSVTCSVPTPGTLIYGK
jgi:hypothetical protein